MFSKCPITEHDNDKTNKINPKHPNIYISWSIFSILFLLDQSSVKSTRRSQQAQKLLKSIFLIAKAKFKILPSKRCLWQVEIDFSDFHDFPTQFGFQNFSLKTIIIFAKYEMLLPIRMDLSRIGTGKSSSSTVSCSS